MLKRRGLRQYGLRGPPSAYQEDHLISLELGGHPTDPRNLWPEPYPRAATVDRIENELNAEVCSGKLSLDDAQRRESLLKHTRTAESPTRLELVGEPREQRDELVPLGRGERRDRRARRRSRPGSRAREARAALRR